jgi:hypothetical protein
MTGKINLSLEHRSVLGKRNVNDRIAMPRHCDVLSPWVLVAVGELVGLGVIEFLGETVIPMPRLGDLSCFIFGLTPRGQELVISHDVWKIAED